MLLNTGLPSFNTVMCNVLSINIYQVVALTKFVPVMLALSLCFCVWSVCFYAWSARLSFLTWATLNE